MLLVISSLLFSTSALSSAWNSSNNPYNIGSSLKLQLNQLPLDGRLKDQRLGWPGNHWPNYVGGIAHRWSSSNPQNFTYKFLTLSELNNLEPHEIRELSPAEKFDILNGNYRYPTVRRVFSRVSPYENEWHGICHGYAPAALNHPEPSSVTLVNPDGISVHFYSSDVSALMSFYYANVVSSPVSLVGSRCNYFEDSRMRRKHETNCKDINAGSFHLILTNKLGLDGTGFVADIDRYAEVWNHIAVNYQALFRGESAPVNTSARGTARRVQLETIVTYAAAIAPKFEPVLNTEAAEYAQQTYEYYLDLDESGQIIGGDWISKLRPDFVWTQEKAIFKNNWESLNEVYRPSQL
jgi:hypothetical protein